MSVKVSNVRVDGTNYPEVELRLMGKNIKGKPAFALYNKDEWVLTINHIPEAQGDSQAIFLFDDMRGSNIEQALVDSGVGTLTGNSVKHPVFNVDCPEFVFSKSALINF